MSRTDKQLVREAMARAKKHPVYLTSHLRECAQCARSVVMEVRPDGTRVLGPAGRA